jgi:sugar phosphate isomerase/epimerase
MNIGFSTNTNLGITLERYMRVARQLKVEFVEIKLDDFRIQQALQPNSFRRIKKIAAASGLRLSAHLPFIDVNLASLNDEIGVASKETVVRWFTRTSELGVELLVAHPGRLSSDYSLPYVGMARDRAIQRLRDLNRAANRLGMRFTVENDHKGSDRLIAGRATDVRDIAVQAGCGVTFDIGHSNTLNECLIFTRIVGDMIENVHLSENDGSSDQHLPIGAGYIDIRRLVRALHSVDYSGPLIIESKSIKDLRTSLFHLRRFLAMT